MSKTFTFQEFSITRTNAAMKLTTDAVLFGSYASECINNRIKQNFSNVVSNVAHVPNCINIEKSIKVLDIGTGTGILSLIVAQKCKQYAPHIIAIDIDDGAISDARFNVEQSNFKDFIIVQKAELVEYAEEQNNKLAFDYIVCNPPYFDFSIDYEDSARYKARCNSSLTPEDLFVSANKLLNEKGSLFIIIPYEQLRKYSKVAYNNDLSINSVKAISSVEGKSPYVALVEYSKKHIHSILYETNQLDQSRIEYEYLYSINKITKTQIASEFWLNLKSNLYLK